MKEEKIKSALEIAMEKVSDLPELTPEEIAEQNEKEYGPIGEAVASRYLNGSITDGELSLEWNKYSGIPERIFRRRLVAAFCGEIRLDNDADIAMKALKGLKLIAADEHCVVDSASEDFSKIVDRFIEQKNLKLRQFEIYALDRLNGLGISGSAIRPNLNEDAQWKEELREIQNGYERQLADIRGRVIRELQ